VPDYEDLQFDDLLDASFQEVLCGVLVHDEMFLARARGIIQTKYFAADTYRALCTGLFNYWDQYNHIPPRSALKIEVSKLITNRATRDAWMTAIDNLYLMPAEDRNPAFIANELVNFAQRAQAAVAIRDAWNDLTGFSIQDLHGNLDTILRLRAIFEDLGENLRLDYEQAYAEDRREIYQTGDGRTGCGHAKWYA